MSRKRKGQRSQQDDLTIVKLAVLAGALEVVKGLIELATTILEKLK